MPFREEGANLILFLWQKFYNKPSSKMTLMGTSREARPIPLPGMAELDIRACSAEGSDRCGRIIALCNCTASFSDSLPRKSSVFHRIWANWNACHSGATLVVWWPLISIPTPTSCGLDSIYSFSFKLQVLTVMRLPLWVGWGAEGRLITPELVPYIWMAGRP